MSIQGQTFTSRVSKRKDSERKAQKVRITLDTQDDDTGEVTFSEAYTFTRPSEGRLFLMATSFGVAARSTNAPAEVEATLEEMLLERAPHPRTGEPGKGEREFLLLRKRIDGPIESRVELEDVMELLGVLVEEWSDFPTQPSSDSSAAPQPTGGNLTGRVHSPAAIPSSSPSTDSWPPSTPGSFGE